MKYIRIVFWFLLWSECCCGVEVHFETSDSGFFLKHSRQPPVAPEISNALSTTSSDAPKSNSYDYLLSVDRFTVVQTSQPVSIRASYGPFSTKQTVPARFIVPDAVENQGEYMSNTTAALIELQQTNLHLDISAHLVRSTVPQDSPVLRVLFHAGADPGGHLQRQKLCILLHVSMGSEIPLKGRCMPEGEDGVCVAEVVIPSFWWPPSPSLYKDGHADIPQKVPQRWVQVSYSVFEPPARNPEQCEPKVQIQPLTSFGQVPLIAAQSPFKNLRLDEHVTLLMPQHPMFPLSKIHVLVYLQAQSVDKIAALTLRARVKSGVKILGATSSSDSWNISFEKENQKHTTARVTVLSKEQDHNSESADSADKDDRLIEVFSWNLEIANDAKEAFDGGKIVWSVNYVYDSSDVNGNSDKLSVGNEETKKKVISKFEINKDDIQAVLPMAKSWELMNTAVLTGRQVAQTMKVFIVSQAGKVADVTLQSSCHAEDESVIKVSSSCSSVYVDGSEIRGSSNASIIVKYGTYIGLAKFIVWMPEFPLEVYISDFRLSQIKGWRVLDESHYLHTKQTKRRKKRSYVWGQHVPTYTNNFGSEKALCRARYQQSPVEVYARFLAIDQNSGRISYFISRRTGLRITDLVQPLLRVADPKIASLKGRILQGKSMGRTDVQVLSPITGRVIGTKEIRVGSDKVSLTKLIVRVVSGLQLTITPDNQIENGYISETSVTHKLTAQYQEGLLDIDLEFSDGTRTPLREISVDDYFLLVESLDTEVVAFAPMLASHHPRVIAVGEGNGDLLRVTLLLSEDCRMRRSVLLTKQVKATVPLASALASVKVDFNNGDTNNKHESVQNDGIVGKDRKGYRYNGDLADIIVGIPFRESGRIHEPTVQARQHRGKIYSMDKHDKLARHSNMTSMEAGMYVLLTAFCFAIIVFVISCVVYASKFRPVECDNGNDPLDLSRPNIRASGILREPKCLKESTTNAHDWVWLGRSTMDRSSTEYGKVGDTNFDICRDSHMRITNNPILKFSNIHENTIPPTSFEPPSTEDNAKDNGQRIPVRDITSRVNRTDGRLYSSPGQSANYRPPIPPHRNIGHLVGNNGNMQANKIVNSQNSIPSARKLEYQVELADQIENNHAHAPIDNKCIHLNSSVANNPVSRVITGTESKPSVDLLPPPQDISTSTSAYLNDENDLHNAEILVENSVHYKKNIFQFDSITPVHKLTVTTKEEDPGLNDENSDIKFSAKKMQTQNGNKPNKDEKGDLVTSKQGSSITRRPRVKRAAVVGNPMFSSSTDLENGPVENLGLDDLDMNYEEIMQYFDNLKESNA